jgi:hypothetical protein
LEVFSDESGQRSENDAPGEWGDLGTRDERKKENTVEATSWKGETLPQKGVAPRTPKVEVFRDVVCLARSAMTDDRVITTKWYVQQRIICSNQSSSPRPSC